MLIALSMLFAAAFALSAVAALFFRSFFRRIGMVDSPDARKDHSEAIPLSGGLTIFFTILVIVGAAIGAVTVVRNGGRIPFFGEIVTPYMEGIFKKLPQFISVLAGGAVILALGFWDDRWKSKGRTLSPWVKLAVEVVVALFLVWEGISLGVFIENRALTAALTVLWIVGITNSFNLLDNMNGLSAGVAWIAAALFGTVAVQTGQWFIAATLMVYAGALLGFLLYNFPKATMFLGDAGSLFIGYFLATVIVLFTFYRGAATPLSVAMPLLILAVPLFDTATVVLLRLKAGSPLFSADHRHFSHRLVALGFSKSQAVLIIFLLTLCLGLAATLLENLGTLDAVVILIQAFGILCVVFLLERRNS
jgi:UDP-GlcNAc:undecaprenyl-phosphate/decaprenyl-phosphate GlcNAc-1-phosphate transferase